MRPRRTEVVIIHVLMVHIDSPVLPNTIDLKDGIRTSGSVAIDTLELKFKNITGVKIRTPTVKW